MAVLTDVGPLGGFPVDRLDEGERLLLEYVGAHPTRPAFAGAAFESYGANDPAVIRPDDVLATSLLSIPIGPPRLGQPGWSYEHVLAIAEKADEVRRLLLQLPTNVDLHELSEAEACQLLAWESIPMTPAHQLYELLRRGLGCSTNPGRVAVYKLLARKRPRLLPVRDSVVERLVDYQTPDPWWLPWWRTLNAEPSIVARLAEIRSSIPPTMQLSLLRTADIVLWMSEHTKGPSSG